MKPLVENGLTVQGESFWVVTHMGSKPILCLPMQEEKSGIKQCYARILRSAGSHYMSECGIFSSGEINQNIYNKTIKYIKEKLPADIIIIEKLCDLDPLFSGIKKAMEINNMLLIKKFSFANWVKSINGEKYIQYHDKLSKKTRKNIRRYQKMINESGKFFDFKLIKSFDDNFESMINSYFEIYKLSWKPDEQKIDFLNLVFRKAAEIGAIRLACIYLDGRPVATKLAFFQDGVLSQFKAAYDPEFKDFGLGTVMNAMFFAHMLDSERVELLDFGNGDEPHKSNWADTRLRRWILVGYDRRRLRGFLAGHLHAVARHLRRGTQSGEDELQA